MPLGGPKGEEEPMANFAPEMMVKQYVGKVRSKTAWGSTQHFMVFTTGNPRYFLFCQLDRTCTYQTGLQFPVKKSDLRRDWRKNLVA